MIGTGGNRLYELPYFCRERLIAESRRTYVRRKRVVLVFLSICMQRKSGYVSDSQVYMTERRAEVSITIKKLVFLPRFPLFPLLIYHNVYYRC